MEWTVFHLFFWSLNVAPSETTQTKEKKILNFISKCMCRVVLNMKTYAHRMMSGTRKSRMTVNINWLINLQSNQRPMCLWEKTTNNKTKTKKKNNKETKQVTSHHRLNEHWTNDGIQKNVCYELENSRLTKRVNCCRITLDFHSISLAHISILLFSKWNFAIYLGAFLAVRFRFTIFSSLLFLCVVFRFYFTEKILSQFLLSKMWNCWNRRQILDSLRLLHFNEHTNEKQNH